MKQKELLAGKVALVTGGSSGIGFGTAKRLMEEGAFVYITGRRKEVLEQAAAKLGSNVKAVQADISNKDDMLRLANIIKEEKGGLDIIFANAGGGKAIPFEEATEADYRRTFDVNVWGTYLTVQTLLPILRDGASIILNLHYSLHGIAGLRTVRCHESRRPLLCPQLDDRLEKPWHPCQCRQSGCDTYRGVRSGAGHERCRCTSIRRPCFFGNPTWARRHKRGIGRCRGIPCIGFEQIHHGHRVDG